MRDAGYDLGSSLTFCIIFSLASVIGGIADIRSKKICVVAFCRGGGWIGSALLPFEWNFVIFAIIGGVEALFILMILTRVENKGSNRAWYPRNRFQLAVSPLLQYPIRDR